MKICLKCSQQFYKKNSHSKKYWEKAKYCSVSCGRLANNPAKLKPNNFNICNDVVKIFGMSLSKGTFTILVDTDDFINNKEISNTRWSLSSPGYPESCLTIGDKHKKKYLHKIIMSETNGLVVDHINGNPLDNRRCNLRYLSHKDNIRNQKVNNILGIPGARLTENKKIELRIKADDKNIRIGLFDTIEDAKKARINAEKEHWGHSFFEEKL